jgi:hypothetical protein
VKHWAAMALVPPTGPWFLVVKCWTRRGAQRELDRFLETNTKDFPPLAARVFRV